MNLKLFLPFLLFTFVQSAEEASVVDPCKEHNENFDLFITCLRSNDYDYNVCREFYNDLDWHEWTANECYFTLHLPRD